MIRKSGQPDELAKFKSKAVWGIVAIFVMTSVWGLVNILVDTFKPVGLQSTLPVFPTGGGSSAGGFNIPKGGGCSLTSDCASGLVCSNYICS